jgi:hypothetical protein
LWRQRSQCGQSGGRAGDPSTTALSRGPVGTRVQIGQERAQVGVIDEINTTTTDAYGETGTETLTERLQEAVKPLVNSKHAMEGLPRRLEIKKAATSDNRSTAIEAESKQGLNLKRCDSIRANMGTQHACDGQQRYEHLRPIPLINTVPEPEAALRVAPNTRSRATAVLATFT